MFLQRVKEKDVFWIVLSLLSLLFIYGPLFHTDIFFSLDDVGVIGAMSRVFSFADYLREMKTGKILDVQPVRDFVTYLNYVSLRTFNFSSFHLMNVLLWFGGVLGFRKIFLLQTEKKDKFLVELFSWMIAVSPLYMGSVAWLTARKHLLAGGLIVWATYYFIKCVQESEKSAWNEIFKFTLLYLLAILSQPIIILWPLWSLFYLWLEKKPLKTWVLSFVPALFLMIAFLYINYQYYTYGRFLYFSRGVTKFVTADEFFRFFALGRYFFQNICPYWTSPFMYDLKNILNLIGFLVWPIFAYIYFKVCGWRHTLQWISFFLCLLLPVVFKMTNIFGNDTYLVGASLGVHLLNLHVLLWLSKSSLVSRRLVLAGLAGITVAYIGITSVRAKDWNQDFLVHKQNYEIEGGSVAEIAYLESLIENRHFPQAALLAKDLYEKNPSEEPAQAAIAFFILADDSMNPDQKLTEMVKYKLFKGRALWFFGHAEYMKGNYKNSYELMMRAARTDPMALLQYRKAERLAAEAARSCEKAQLHDCAAGLKVFKNINPFFYWNESEYQAQLNELGVKPSR